MYFQILTWPNFCPQILKKGVSESLSVASVAAITERTMSTTLSTNSCLALEAALFSPTRLCCDSVDGTFSKKLALLRGNLSLSDPGMEPSAQEVLP